MSICNNYIQFRCIEKTEILE